MQQAYCHMTTIPGCSGAGWTLAMKISGNEVKQLGLFAGFHLMTASSLILVYGAVMGA